MNLVEFLLARLAEDEAAALAGNQEGAYLHFGDTAAEECVEMAKSEGCAQDGYRHLRRWLPARVLAECEAKRRVIELHSPPRAYQAPSWGPEDTDPPRYELEPWQANQCTSCGWFEEWQAQEYGATYPCGTLLALALPYADHPDHDETWRP